jgi:hypothetical protein
MIRFFITLETPSCTQVVNKFKILPNNFILLNPENTIIWPNERVQIPYLLKYQKSLKYLNTRFKNIRQDLYSIKIHTYTSPTPNTLISYIVVLYKKANTRGESITPAYAKALYNIKIPNQELVRYYHAKIT